MNYGGLFESWELGVAKRVINDYRREHRNLAREGFDDLLQECLIHWLDVRDQYDPSRGASKKTYMADIVAYNKIIVEIKAIDSLSGREEAQLLNYLKATNHGLGLLINFLGRRN